MKKNDSYDEVQVDYVKKVGVFKEIKMNGDNYFILRDHKKYKDTNHVESYRTKKFKIFTTKRPDNGEVKVKKYIVHQVQREKKGGKIISQVKFETTSNHGNNFRKSKQVFKVKKKDMKTVYEQLSNKLLNKL